MTKEESGKEVVVQIQEFLNGTKQGKVAKISLGGEGEIKFASPDIDPIILQVVKIELPSYDESLVAEITYFWNTSISEVLKKEVCLDLSWSKMDLDMSMETTP